MERQIGTLSDPLYAILSLPEPDAGINNDNALVRYDDTAWAGYWPAWGNFDYIREDILVLRRPVSGLRRMELTL
jgi:hypothetical protein